MGTVIPIKDLAKPSSARPHCGLAELCLPHEASAEHAENHNGFACSFKRVKRGESLYRAGDPFVSLYPVRLGSFKTSIATTAGCDQVTGFHMRGEIMGFEGLDTGTHPCTAIALEDSLICIVPFGLLEENCATNPLLQRQFHKAMSSQIELRQAAMLILGTMHAEERLAAYLLDISERFGVRGYSRHEFNLRMTREEIGSLIGLTLETVSRAFARFQKAKLLSIEGKAVTGLDLQGLRQVIGHHVQPN